MAKPASCATATAALPEKAYRPWIPATGSSDGTPSYPRPTTAIHREYRAKDGLRKQPRHPAPERRRTARPSHRRKLFCTRLRQARRVPATVPHPQGAWSRQRGRRPEPDPKRPKRARRRSTAAKKETGQYGGAWRSPKLIFHDHKGVLLIRQDTGSHPSGVPPQTPPRGSALRGESAPAFSGNHSGKPPLHRGASSHCRPYLSSIVRAWARNSDSSLAVCMTSSQTSATNASTGRKHNPATLTA